MPLKRTATTQAGLDLAPVVPANLEPDILVGNQHLQHASPPRALKHRAAQSPLALSFTLHQPNPVRLKVGSRSFAQRAVVQHPCILPAFSYGTARWLPLVLLQMLRNATIGSKNGHSKMAC